MDLSARMRRLIVKICKSWSGSSHDATDQGTILTPLPLSTGKVSLRVTPGTIFVNPRRTSIPRLFPSLTFVPTKIFVTMPETGYHHPNVPQVVEPNHCDRTFTSQIAHGKLVHGWMS